MDPKNNAQIRMLSDTEFQITRVFNAPRELVFRAHTDPDLIPLWWGPRDTTTIVEQMDVRPGGTYRFSHRTEDGSQYSFFGEFREINPPERLVQTSEFSGAPGHVIVETLIFTEDNGRTTLTVIEQFSSIEDRDQMLASGMESGLSESYVRLDELLARQTTFR